MTNEQKFFFAEYYDVTVHLTFDLLDIKCHNLIILSFKIFLKF